MHVNRVCHMWLYMYVEVKSTNINIMFSFFRLRVRIKALQQTIDTQSVRITDLISSQVLASMDGMKDYTFFCCLVKAALDTEFVSQCNVE